MFCQIEFVRWAGTPYIRMHPVLYVYWKNLKQQQFDRKIGALFEQIIVPEYNLKR